MSRFAAAENGRSKLLIKKHLLQRIFEPFWRGMGSSPKLPSHSTHIALSLSEAGPVWEHDVRRPDPERASTAWHYSIDNSCVIHKDISVGGREVHP